MNTYDLLQAQQAVEASFNDLSKRKTETEEEMLRLQGEYRAYQAQIDRLKKEEADPIETHVPAAAEPPVEEAPVEQPAPTTAPEETA